MGFFYVMTKKSMKHASADVGLIFTFYNLRRIFNTIDQNKLKKFSKELFEFILRRFIKSIRETISSPIPIITFT